MSTVTKGARTRAEIISVGLKLWREHGAERVTASRVAGLLGITHGACLYHFGSTSGMRDAIAAHAVRAEDGIVVPQLIAIRHPAVAHFTLADKASYLNTL